MVTEREIELKIKRDIMNKIYVLYIENRKDDKATKIRLETITELLNIIFGESFSLESQPLVQLKGSQN